MSGVTIGWDNAAPANTDLVGQGDDQIRSFKSNVQGGLAAEHLWPSGGGLSGVHALGSARVFVGPASQVSSADTSGRLMFDSTNSKLHYVGVEGTAAIGGQTGVSMSTLLPPLSASSSFWCSFISVTQNTWPTGPLSMGMPVASALLRPAYFASVFTTVASVLTPVFPVIFGSTPNSPQIGLFNLDGSQSTLTWTVNVFAIGYGPSS